MADRIQRCTDCGDWTWERWCWSCWHAARNRAARLNHNLALMAAIKEDA